MCTSEDHPEYFLIRLTGAVLRTVQSIFTGLNLMTRNPTLCTMSEVSYQDQLECGFAVSDLLAPCLVYSRNARESRKGRARNPIMSCQCERKQRDWKRLSSGKNRNVSQVKLSEGCQLLSLFLLLSFGITLALGL